MPGSAPAAERLFRLDGRTAFVSGAAGHLGSAMARLLAEAGATVLINGRDADRAKSFARSLSDDGLRAEAVPFDMTDTAALRRFFGGLDRLDILINNAVTMRTARFETAQSDDFALAHASSAGAAFEAVRAALPALETAARAADDASVINVATMYAHVAPDPSIYGETGLNSPPHYGAAKAALVQLTRHLACELGPRRIRVNSVSPGPFPSPQVQDSRPAFVEKLAAKTPLGRVGRASEIAGAVLFLASDASTYVTGADLRVDGGWTAW